MSVDLGDKIGYLTVVFAAHTEPEEGRDYGYTHVQHTIKLPAPADGDLHTAIEAIRKLAAVIQGVHLQGSVAVEPGT